MQRHAAFQVTQVELLSEVAKRESWPLPHGQLAKSLGEIIGLGGQERQPVGRSPDPGTDPTPTRSLFRGPTSRSGGLSLTVYAARAYSSLSNEQRVQASNPGNGHASRYGEHFRPKAQCRDSFGVTETRRRRLLYREKWRPRYLPDCKDTRKHQHQMAHASGVNKQPRYEITF
jgi:hypothetical protein